MGNEKDSNVSKNFGQKLNKKRRQIFPIKHATEESILESLLEDKRGFDTSKQSSRAIDYQNEKPFRDMTLREQLKQKLRFDLEPKASLSNQTLTIHGLSVSTKQIPPALSSLPFDRKLLNQLGSLLPGGGPADNVDEIHAELQGMLFGDDSVEEDDKNIKNTNNPTNNTNTHDITTLSTSIENDENLTFYDLVDYVDYTEDKNIEYEEYDNIELLDSEDEEDEIDHEHISIDDPEDQDVAENIQFDTSVPINSLNITSSSLPLVAKRRQSYVRFPKRQLKRQQNKIALNSKLGNRRRILQQQLQNEEISSRIMNKPPNRRHYISEPRIIEDDYDLDYEGNTFYNDI